MVTLRAMACQVIVTVPARESPEDAAVMSEALEVFGQVESECTRFDPASPLSRANAAPEESHRVPPYLFEALCEAFEAHRQTGGLYDPRVLKNLEVLGYDAGLRFDGSSTRELGVPLPTWSSPWSPNFVPGLREVVLEAPVDLGGIGKGLAVRWASEVLARRFDDFIVEAGGDCFLSGRAPDGERWRVGVEDPHGGEQPLAVLAVSDRAVATSSLRRRRWLHGATPVHHLIDPRTGHPGGEGLASVPVVAHDPARAEVAAKALFLAGSRDVAEAARRGGIDALWCDHVGRVGMSEGVTPHVIWERR